MSDSITYRKAVTAVTGRADIQIRTDADGNHTILPEEGAPPLPVIDQAMLDAIEAAAATTALATSIDDAKRRVVARADELGEIIAGIAPNFEKHSWPDKREAAMVVKQVIAASGTPTPADDPRIVILMAEASVTGETLEALADKILANVDVSMPANYYAAVGMIAGQRRATIAAIDALSDPATVDADIAGIFAAAEANAQALLQSLLSG